MNNLKLKEPLIAVMLAVVVTGLGQIYAGKAMRGIVFFVISLILAMSLTFYLLSPISTIYPPSLLLLAAVFGYNIFVIVDAYRCAKAYNLNNGLNRTATVGKKALLIAGIIIVEIIINLVQIGSALYVRSNIVQAFKIPSKTMEPALLQGDRIFADKAVYKKSEPKRGDVIVYVSPEEPEKMFVKRLVGLSGETIEIRSGAIIINGLAMQEGAFADKHYNNAGEYGQEGQSVKIPEDSYYVLGDNSALSRDSRYTGFVPRKNVVGKAYKIYYPFKRSGAIK